MNKIKALESNKGKFVGIKSSDGRSYNAQYLGSTSKYITFRNTRNGQKVTMSKAKLKNVSVGGQLIGRK